MRGEEPTNNFVIRPTGLIGWSLLLALIAMAPRVIGLADFLTTDEVYHWIDRTARFAQALESGRWADTILTGHPGVTTMWLGVVGRGLEAWFGSDGAAPPLLAHLAWLRLPSAIVHALIVGMAFLIIRPIIGLRPALLMGLFWATTPYLIAHSRVLHLDALLTDWVVLSLLLLLLYGFREPQRHPWRWPLFLSGGCAGLALLTKGPALILLPFIGLALLYLVPADGWSIRAMVQRILAALRIYALWLGCALIVVAICWPALWADPARALSRYIAEITTNGGRPNGDGQFFWGQAIGDPGPFFYLVANLFRTTPGMLIGLLAIPLVRWGHFSSSARRSIGVLVAFILFWTLIMTLGPKKFDRYVLPTWPALLILAALGWDALLNRIGQVQWRRVVASTLVVCECALVVWFHPYYLSYYNPLLGGGRVAQQLFLIGWGEGMDQVGAYLRSRSDLSYGPVLSALGPTLQPFVPVDVRDVSDYGRLPANYAVVYLESIQRAADPALYAKLQQTHPLTTITIHGIEYATIYQLPRPFAQPLPAQFGDSLAIHGYTLEQQPGQLILTLAWDVRRQPSADYLVFVHLIDANGQRVAQIDLPPGGDAPPTSAWEPGRQVAVPFPIGIPADLPAGSYRLLIGVYDPASGTRLPLQGVPPADPALAGNDALLVATLNLP